MAQSDTPETALALCGATSPTIVARFGPDTACTRHVGHVGTHSRGDIFWEEPSDRVFVAQGNGDSWRDPLDPGLIAGGQLTGKGGNGATTDFRAGIVIGGQLAGSSSPGGGSATGFASGGIGGIAGGGGKPSAGYASTHGQGGAGPGGGIHEPGSLRFVAGGKSAGPERVLGVTGSVPSSTLRVAPGRCGAENLTVGSMGATCKRTAGHYGAHDDDAGHSWSAAPPRGPVPERFRTMPRPPELEPLRAAVDAAFAAERACQHDDVAAGMPCSKCGRTRPPFPGDTIEILLAGLVACGRAIGRVGREIDARKHWRAVLSAGLQGLGADVTPDSELTDEQWSKLGRYLWASVQLAADAKSEPVQPIQLRAEALAILIMKGQRTGVPPNFLIRAGAVLEVCRSIWRTAKRGGT